MKQAQCRLEKQQQLMGKGKYVFGDAKGRLMGPVQQMLGYSVLQIDNLYQILWLENKKTRNDGSAPLQQALQPVSPTKKIWPSPRAK